MGRWIDASFYEHDGKKYGVCYRHLMRGAVLDDDRGTFFSFRLHPREADNGYAQDWIEEFAFTIQQTGKVFLASLESRYADLYSVGFNDCGGSKLFIELLRSSDVLGLKLPLRPEPKAREFLPQAFVDAEDSFAKAVLDEIGPSQQEIDQLKREYSIRLRSRS